MKAGDTFDAPSGATDHLFVIAGGPDATGKVVIANFTSWESGIDESCVIERGSTVLLGKKSVVAYDFSQVTDIEALMAHVRSGEIRERHTPLRAELLKRVQDGFFLSRNAPAKCRVALRAMGIGPMPAQATPPPAKASPIALTPKRPLPPPIGH